MSPARYVPALIDRWLPERARLLERHAADVDAPPERTFRAIDEVRLQELPIVRLLFAVRRVPYRNDLTLRRFFATPPFILLEETPDQEAVFGIAGGLWRPAKLASADEFRAHVEATGNAVLANFQVERLERGSRIATETWVQTTGLRTSVLFRCYWLVVGLFSALTRRLFLRAIRERAEQADR